MAAKDDLQGHLEYYADHSGDLDLRVFVGTPGYRIEVRNTTEDTGQGYVSPGFLEGLIQAIGALVEQEVVDELEVTNPGGQSSYTLSKTPAGDAVLAVYRNGLLLRPGVEYTRSGRQISGLPGVFGDWFCFRYRWIES